MFLDTILLYCFPCIWKSLWYPFLVRHNMAGRMRWSVQDMIHVIRTMVELLLKIFAVRISACMHKVSVETIKKDKYDYLSMGGCGGGNSTCPGMCPFSLAPPVISSLVTRIGELW